MISRKQPDAGGGARTSDLSQLSETVQGGGRVDTAQPRNRQTSLRYDHFHAAFSPRDPLAQMSPELCDSYFPSPKRTRRKPANVHKVQRRTAPDGDAGMAAALRPPAKSAAAAIGRRLSAAHVGARTIQVAEPVMKTSPAGENRPMSATILRPSRRRGAVTIRKSPGTVAGGRQWMSPS